MLPNRVPVLWITGPAGVGKSTASWQIFTELAEAAVPVAFADTDQFCICYPAPPDDPGRERIKARNAGALFSRAQAAGARCVIANGVTDPGYGVLRALMPQADVLTCRLRAGEGDLVRRFLGRREPGINAAEVLAGNLSEARAMEASSFADVCVDTTGAAAGDVARLVIRACHDWAGFGAPVPAAPPRSYPAPQPGNGIDATENGQGTGGTVLLLCGPRGVGKSTIGFQVYLRLLRQGLTAGYLDLDQLGFIRHAAGGDQGRHRLKAGNLADMWRTYRAAGATHLIATGPIDSEAALRTYAAGLPGASVTVCRLHAGPSELLSRIMSRGDGGSWPQPGDPLRGRPASYLRRVAAEAAADAEALERAGLGTVRIDTGGLTVAEAADLVESASGSADAAS